MVQEALGFDEARGDSVTVTSSPFVDALEVEVAPWYENESIKELAQQLATVLILAIVIFGALHPLLKRVLVPAGYTTGVGYMALDEEDDADEDTSAGDDDEEENADDDDDDGDGADSDARADDTADVNGDAGHSDDAGDEVMQTLMQMTTKMQMMEI